MASAQCYRPTEQPPCHQQQQHQSLGQKVTHVVGSVFKKDHTHQAHQTHYQSNQAHHQALVSNQCHTTANSHFPMGNTNGTHTHETQCHGNGKTSRTHNKKRGLLSKMKDGLSGHSSDSSSSSESDSDDDNKCPKN